MTVQADPQATFRLVLSQHQHLPKADQPVFYFRFLTVRQRSQLLAAFAAADTAAEGKDGSDAVAAQEFYDAHLDAIKAHLAGWENQTDETGSPLAYDLDDLDRCIDDADLMELRHRVLVEMNQGAMDRKKSVQQSPSSSVPAAPDADPVSV